MPVILVTNDDGIASHGIKILARTLESVGDVYVVAPETEQSAVAHALTLHRPLKFTKTGKNKFCINGTPTDCIIIGVNKILPVKPDIIVSGINNGGNLGDDITYSGTVAAAIEGTLLGIPSIAVSLVTNYMNDKHGRRLQSKILRFKTAADYACRIIEKVLDKGLPRDTLLNMNIPNIAMIRGTVFTKQGSHIYDNAIKELSDPRGRRCFWIGGGIPKWESGENTDFDAIHNGYISVTPLHLDMTNYKALDYLRRKWGR